MQLIKTVLWSLVIVLFGALVINSFYSDYLVLIYLVLGIITTVETIAAIEIGEVQPHE